MASTLEETLSSSLATAAADPTFPTTPASLASPTSTTVASIGNYDLLKPIGIPASMQRSPKLQASPRVSPVSPLTGAVALAESERRPRREAPTSVGTSPNPASVVQNLLASQGGMSTPKDAPTATTSMSSALAEAADRIVLHQTGQEQLNGRSQTVSGDGLGRRANTATAHPGPDSLSTAHDANLSPDASSRAFSLPGNMVSGVDSLSTPNRSGSLPHSGWSSMDSPRSGGRGEHKCSYCDLRFTRPHNLKSHLLTHSQEKPFSCAQCPLKFRRQHDLKRHLKLHTGERPHICEKCGRKFARGDALNRHTRAQGGCAGRRGSIDGLGGDDDLRRASLNTAGGHDDSMDGLLFTGQQNDVERMDMDADSEVEVDRRASMPTMRAPPTVPPEHVRQPSTYPPVTEAGYTSRLYPPVRASTATSSEHTSSTQRTAPTSLSSAGTSIAPPLLIPGSSMTESPKPLSPHTAVNNQHANVEAAAAAAAAAMAGGQRKSPPQHYGRRSTRGGSSVDLPPINTATTHQSLPPLNERYHTNSLPPPPPPPPSLAAVTSQPSESANMFASIEGMYQYMQSHMRQLEDKVNRLQDEVISLRSQLAAQSAANQSPIAR